eukprot:TRINITY_DN3894_c0_g1_i3.p1 TRINITY_DN3894_c0_g1~~TRINITY_DN3894_c0_g1_i3.p1  ORF type:complete len:116 (-),score=30.08 TRINITY_DN3894_c0_g1_i3:174-491(-)
MLTPVAQRANSAGISMAISDMLPNNENTGTWILAGYEEGNMIEIREIGHGGVDELRNHLKDDEIMYLIIRVPASMGHSAEGTIRDVYINWVGPDVKTIERARGCH